MQEFIDAIDGLPAVVKYLLLPVSLPRWNTFKRALFGIFPRYGGSP